MQATVNPQPAANSLASCRSIPAENGAILAIDAAGHACSVALWRNGAVTVKESQLISHGQAAELMPMVERVMAAADFDLRQVERVAVAVGPGGFTGLRIAVATARGLGLAIGCPVIGISSFQAMAATLAGEIGEETGDIAIALDSRREEPYLALLAPDLSFRAQPRLIASGDIAAFLAMPGLRLICGDGLSPIASSIPAALRQIAGNNDAATVAALAADPARRFDLPPDPHYLRPPDISQPKSAVAAKGNPAA